jgi:hypothetical protein
MNLGRLNHIVCSPVVASVAKQSSAVTVSLDCFAALAMTVSGGSQ